MAGDTALGHFAVQVAFMSFYRAYSRLLVRSGKYQRYEYARRVQERQQNSNHTTWICYLGKRRQPNEQIVWTCSSTFTQVRVKRKRKGRAPLACVHRCAVEHLSHIFSVPVNFHSCLQHVKAASPTTCSCTRLRLSFIVR
ncbi:hypothetical protein TGARI_306730 [Toxoplasma gondii ARI]|uniref:Uncharacterized protein n=1 Tax=Toxoplasma gondii ARI TaxID=1074872 RepID=A0A139Y0T2_TOXGO|nr:hypothetical protein TGARI_306730 [Toxoplasma gondii ARI]